MKFIHSLLLLVGLTIFSPLAAETPPAPGAGAKPLFDGKSLDGWEGNAKLWKVEEGILSGGSLTVQVAHNDFIATTRDYENFILRAKLKLTGTGFVNSGIQIRSQRVPNNSEMAGYQCDYGDPTWWGCIYDESRRNKVMAQSDMKALDPVIKRDDWNEYVIKADGRRIQTWINGVAGVDYTEADLGIVQAGKIGIQIHGGGKALIQVKEFTIEELPASPKPAAFTPAPEPAKMRALNDGPLSAAEQAKTFVLPPGFEIELVAEEAPGIGKFITTAWDHHGRLWTMTALEYPVDANENRPAAEALYASKAKDKVLCYDFASRGDGTAFPSYQKKPTVFAEGLAIPLGMLPYKDGAIVQHGKEIVFLRDTDKDGKADQREVLLEGVGIDDSHLFLHGFKRGPGNWIYTAQGAFNHSQIKAKDGSVTKWDFCKMGRFTPDGQKFELVAAGLNNIWGFVIDRAGLMWGQEANDMGYPLTELAVGDNFPGIGNEKLKPYAPVRPKAVSDWQVGGTGLSGLALQEDVGVWPGGYGPQADAPNARTFYLANPITNRIQATQAMPDGQGHFQFTKIQDFVRTSDPWFRPIHLSFGPDGALYIVDWYNKIISHNEVPRNHPERDKERGRIWRVKKQGQKSPPVPDIAAMNEAELKAFQPASTWAFQTAWAEKVDRGLADPNGPEWPRKDLRWELSQMSLPKIAALIKAPDGSYDADFTRYMVRAELENRSVEVAAYLESPEGGSAPAEFVVLVLQSLEPLTAARQLAKMQSTLKRPYQDEELFQLLQFSEDPAVAPALAGALSGKEGIQALMRLRTRLDATKLSATLAKIAESALAKEPAVGLRLIESFQIKSLEPAVAAKIEGASDDDLPVLLRTLRAVGSKRLDLYEKFLTKQDAAIRTEALLGLAAAPEKVIPLWDSLNPVQRQVVVQAMTSSKPGAEAFVSAISSGKLPAAEVDGPLMEKLLVLLGAEHAGLRSLLEKMPNLFASVLQIAGKSGSCAKSDITLEGAFTVECWVQLAPEIGNDDGILGAKGVLDMNFYGGQFRVWAGGGVHDAIIAKKAITPGMWTHVCVTRNDEGHFKIYLNGELDQAEGKTDKTTYAHCQIGWTGAGTGMQGSLTEFRAWNVCRSADEIRANFDRELSGAKPTGLAHRFSGADWPALEGTAKVMKTTDFPSLVTVAGAAALDEKFAKFRALAEKPGNVENGKALSALCTACHTIKNEGGLIGPNLSGAGAMGTEALLRNILTPNAAMEAGYRVHQVLLKDGTVHEGFLAEQNDEAIVLRAQGIEDKRIPKSDILKSTYLKRSLMPEGLIDALPPELISDLFSYLKTLK